MEQNGGKIIFESVHSAIFRPSLPCNTKRYNRKNKQISKIFFDKHSYKTAKNEYDINEYIKSRVYNHNNYFTLWNKMCKPPSFETFLKYDKDIGNIIQDPKIFDKNSIMLIGDNYGSDLLDKFIEDIKKLSITTIIKKYLVYIYDILLCTSKLHEINISHNDIHLKNIMVKNNKPKLIDFGISSYLNHTDFLKNRSNKLLEEKRLFISTPPDIIFLNIKKHKDIKTYTQLQYYDLFKLIHNTVLTKKNIVPQLKDIFTKNQSNNSRLFNNLNLSLEKLDVYSIGMLIPYIITLYFDYKQTSLHNIKEILKKHTYISDFLKLFNNMTDLNVKNRYNLSQSIDEYKELLEKHKLI